MTKLVVLLVLFTGCKKKDPPPTPKDAPQFQVPIGGNADEQPRLPFQITKVYEHQKPDGAGHSDGGDWTFFDADASGAKFTFGFHTKSLGSDFSFGDAWLGVPDRADGDKLVAELAQAFKVKAPPPGAQLPLSPMRFSVALLGTHTRRAAGGGFGGAGSWYATKIFPESGEKQAEVFFNFTLDEKSGEFSEKDADYDQDLVTICAQGLRDGMAAKKK